MRKGLVLTITLLALLVMPTIVEARVMNVASLTPVDDIINSVQGFVNQIVEQVMNVFRFMRGRVGSLMGVETSCLDDRFNDYCSCPAGSSRRTAKWFVIDFYACELDNKVVDPDAVDFESQAYGHMAYLFSAQCGIGFCDFTCEASNEEQVIVSSVDADGKRWVNIRCLVVNGDSAYTKYRMMASVEEGSLNPFLQAYCITENYVHGVTGSEETCVIG